MYNYSKKVKKLDELLMHACLKNTSIYRPTIEGTYCNNNVKHRLSDKIGFAKFIDNK